MIAFVKGELIEIEKNSVVIEAGGLGYRVFTPIGEELVRISIGNTVKLYTYMNVREDATELYGFFEKQSLSLFKKLIGVSGVGPKIALAILSAMDVTKVTLAILSEDKKTLTKISGVGPKMAARICLDLKDKVSTEGINMEGVEIPTAVLNVTSGPLGEAIEALMSLGYTAEEAKSAVGKVNSDGMTTEEIIKAALRQLY